MKFEHTLFLSVIFLAACTMNENLPITRNEKFKPYTPPLAFNKAQEKADSILSQMSIEEKIEMIGGHDQFFIHEIEKANLPRLYLSDATQGIHIRKELDKQLEKSTAMPCPVMLCATWNRKLAHEYAKCIGEECRAGDIAVLLGPGMNLYRIAQNGRNFEYFGEDPYLAARMIENYVTGIQSTGTIATLKHFIANNTDYRRRTSNSIVSERALHELYMPAFKAGSDAGAMAVMTSYNQLNGEWCSQSQYVINKLLRKDIGFKWLVMSDWWSIWEPEKALKSGIDLDMPGEMTDHWRMFKTYGDSFLRSNAKQLLNKGTVSENDINRMVRNIMTTELAMELDKRVVKDESFLDNYAQHEAIALQTASEGIVLLKNDNDLLPITNRSLKILATGEMMMKQMSGGGSAFVEGYNWLNMRNALDDQFGSQVRYIENPDDEEIETADLIICATGTFDSEGADKPFSLPDTENQRIQRLTMLNSKVVIVVNSGSGIEMTPWVENVAAIVYSWYPGQNGNKALASILAGETCPSGKLPITIENKFEDSPGYPYLPKGEKLYTGWGLDSDMSQKIYNIEYTEDVLVGYRWYEAKKIDPLFPFGFGLSYTTFEYENLKLSSPVIKQGEQIKVWFTLENTGEVEGAEIAQLYIADKQSSAQRPIKELKNFIKVNLKPGEKKLIELEITETDLSFYDETSKSWIAEPGEFSVLIGSSSSNILLKKSFQLEN